MNLENRSSYGNQETGLRGGMGLEGNMENRQKTPENEISNSFHEVTVYGKTHQEKYEQAVNMLRELEGTKRIVFSYKEEGDSLTLLFGENREINHCDWMSASQNN